MRLSTFSTTKFLVTGGVLIFCGLLSIALGIASATPVNGSYPFGHIGYGIWGGFFYVIGGSINVIVSLKTTPDLVVWSMVLNITCCTLGVLQLALGITSANQDFNIMRLRNLHTSGIFTEEILAGEMATYYERFFPMTYLLAQSQTLVQVHNGVIAVDSLLAFAGFLVAIVAAIAAASAGRVICCPNLLTDLDTVTVVSAIHHEGRQKSSFQVQQTQ